jgi:hypothetical protein
MSFHVITVFLQILLVGIQGSGTCAPVPPEFSYPDSQQDIHIQGVERIKNLKGKITGPNDSTIDGPVLIEIMDGSKEGKRISACFADSDGNFDFGVKKKGRYHLKISMKGFDTTYIKILIGNFKKESLPLILYPSAKQGKSDRPNKLFFY